MTIGLAKAALWLPQGFEDAPFIATQTGIPLEVVKNKLGIVRKCRASAEQHPSFMAIEAVSQILKSTDPLSIDLVIWTGSEYKDFPVWTASIFVQEQCGLKNAWAFDLAARCSSNVVGIKVAKALMTADPSLRRVLLCGGHRTGDLVNYADPNTRFLYSLSDGGSALLLERDGPNPILESSVMTDGSFSHDVIIPGGGTRHPNRLKNHPNWSYLTAPDIQGMRERLADRSIENFLKVIRQASSSSLPNPIDYLALLHLKRSAHDTILEALNLGQHQSVYMDHFGHFGAPDQVVSLALAEYNKLLKPGAHVVMASAGIGYVWSAISILWEQPILVGRSVEETLACAV